MNCGPCSRPKPRTGLTASLLAVALGVLLFALPKPADATGGRLNAAGCHSSKKTGYHCHRAATKARNATAPGKR